MTDAEGLVEAVCRAICVAEGHNPDMVYAINATGSMLVVVINLDIQR